MLYERPDLRSLARDLAEGRTSALELAEQALAAVKLDAYRTLDPERTRAAARAADLARSVGISSEPLHGVPISVKDLYAVQGWPTFAGTPNRLPERFERTGPLVQRALDQRAVVVGKTQTVELAFGGIGTNPHWGTPINPWSAGEPRVPGGSSAGAGVSLQEGSALVAFGTDTAGSCRIPAAWTGTVGLKTTVGRWSTAGVVPLSTTLDTTGILTRTVSDASFAFAALDGSPAPVPVDLACVRLAVGADPFWAEASPGVVEAVEHAIAEIPGPVPRSPGLPFEAAYELFQVGGPVSAELDAFLEEQLPAARGTLDPNVAARVASAGDLTVREYLHRRHRLVALAAEARAVFDEVDVILTPTVANTPPTVAELADAAVYRTQNLLCLRNTAIASYLGLCALTLPCGLDASGMPVGLQLIAGPHQEALLLGVGLALERRLGRATERLGRPPRLV